MLIVGMNLRDISLFLYFKLSLCRTRLIRSDQSVFYVSKINLQFPIINHNRDNIIKCIHMGIIFSFEEIAQYGLTFRIYDPVFPDTGALIFRNFFYVIAAAAGRRYNLDTKVWRTINTFFDKPVELADYGNIRLDHCAVVTVELHIKRGRKDFTCTFVIVYI